MQSNGNIDLLKCHSYEKWLDQNLYILNLIIKPNKANFKKKLIKLIKKDLFFLKINFNVLTFD